MTHPPPYVALSDALAGLLAQVVPVEPQLVSPAEATGSILAQPLKARDDVPLQSVALREGWAVASGELVGASAYSPILLARPPSRVAIGQTLPSFADAVLPPDAVAMTGALVEVTDGVAPGEGVRRRGEDAGKDLVLREAGRAVRAFDVAIAAAAGIATCRVRKPLLRLFAPEPDAAATLLEHLAASWGARVERVDVEVLSDPTPLRADLVVILNSGTLAPNAVDRAGSVRAARLAVRPGEGAGCGLVGTVPVLWCPPRLEVALALALTLLKPCIDRLAGALGGPCAIDGRLTRKISSSVGFTELALLRRTAGGLEPLAVADLTLAAFAAADAWLLVPPESEGFAAGDTVSAVAL